jgi:GWxTD domain-containing protein
VYRLKKRTLLCLSLFFFLTLLFTLFPLYSQKKASVSSLPEKYRKWLEEEVVYIITPLEREVFLQLTSDRERDLYIEAFWKHRDPNPSTPENEFKTEHYRRINYANHFFRESPKPGWMTDRGRMYIILGEPNDIQRYSGKSAIYPCEVWFYQGKTDLGLPPAFHLVFFQQGGIGEYRLYSPSKDGPQALMTSYEGDPIDYQAAYEQLREIEPELANVSISLIPGEESPTMGRPSLSSDILVQRVESTPQRLAEDKYAQKFLQYKDIVEVEYTANYIDCDALVKIIEGEAAVPFVHLAVEPARLSVEQLDSNKYFTQLKVNVSVTTMDGQMVYQFDRSVNVNLDQNQLAAASRQPFNLHELFPLVPGRYRVSVLIKNDVSKEFTSWEREIIVPEASGPHLSPLLLGYRLVRQEGPINNLKPFRLGPVQVYAQPGRVFSPADTLYLGFKVYSLEAIPKEKISFRYSLLREGQEVWSNVKQATEYPDWPVVIEATPLASLPPAHYQVKVSLLIEEKEVSQAEEEFDLSHQAAIPRPWVHARVLPPASDPVYDFIIGSQLVNLGRLEAAESHLRRAHLSRPDSPDFSMSLAQLYSRKGEFSSVIDLLAPFMNPERPPRYEMMFLLATAYQKEGQAERALQVIDQAITHYGVNINILNLAGECHLQLGQRVEALQAFQKSLELVPDQPEVRRLVELLKEKK